ncbi:hypothetical protein CPAR01_06339 [Colletotrichum paranaense]|uniref:Transposase n=1 Tax=Colletotrichum paranaense TaxID=1914294 RepID=A0ABQ9SLT5_9PEZI|nr:uncharacterized protein CPAR01_06339 [Colletotrichum paranaense]KAK1540350.1 hypothetical protein CPAR01_06339 [Colletotrichum paranaense]
MLWVAVSLKNRVFTLMVVAIHHQVRLGREAKYLILHNARAHTTASPRTLYKYASPVLGVDADTPSGAQQWHTLEPQSRGLLVNPPVSLPALGAKLCTISIARLMFSW